MNPSVHISAVHSSQSTGAAVSADGGTDKKGGCVCRAEYYSAVKRMSDTVGTAWIDPGSIMRGEISQTGKHKTLCDFTSVESEKVRNKKLINTENTLVTAIDKSQAGRNDGK